MNTSLKLSKKLSFGEEIANSVTHAVGAVIMLILLPISSTYSYEAHGFLSSFWRFYLCYQSLSHVPLVNHLPLYGLWFDPQIRLANHRPFYDLCGYRRLLYAGRIDFDE